MEFIFFVIVIIIILSALSSFAKKANEAASSGKSVVTPAALGKKLFSAMTSSSRNETWMQLAGDLGLTYLAPKTPFDTPVITGKIAGRDIDISMNEIAPGSHETVFKIKLPRSLDMGLLISKDKQSVQNRLFSGRKRFANIDFVPGNIENVIASAFDEKAFRNFLSKRRSNILMNFLGLYQFVNITDDTITVRIPGSGMHYENLQKTVRALVKVSEMLGTEMGDAPEENNAAASEAMPEEKPEIQPVHPAVNAVQEKSQTAPKLTIPAKSPMTAKPSVLTDMAIPAAVSTATVMSAAESSKSISEAQKESAQKSAAQSGSFQGHKPAVVSEVGRAPTMKQDTLIKTSTPGFKPADDKKAEAPVQNEKSVDELMDQKNLCEALFSSSFGGSKEKETFEKVKGAEIHWKGILKSAYEYGSDFVFGQTPGVKATFEIYEITGNYSMKTKIKAVVQLPKDVFQTLKTQTGKELSFAGKLEKFESFAKEIYVSSGNIV